MGTIKIGKLIVSQKVKYNIDYTEGENKINYGKNFLLLFILSVNIRCVMVIFVFSEHKQILFSKILNNCESNLMQIIQEGSKYVS